MPAQIGTDDNLLCSGALPSVKGSGRNTRNNYLFHFDVTFSLVRWQKKFSFFIYEPRCEKTGFLHMRKQRRRSASR